MVSSSWTIVYNPDWLAFNEKHSRPMVGQLYYVFKGLTKLQKQTIQWKLIGFKHLYSHPKMKLTNLCFKDTSQANGHFPLACTVSFLIHMDYWRKQIYMIVAVINILFLSWKHASWKMWPKMQYHVALHAHSFSYCKRRRKFELDPFLSNASALTGLRHPGHRVLLGPRFFGYYVHTGG